MAVPTAARWRSYAFGAKTAKLDTQIIRLHGDGSVGRKQ